MLLNWCLVFFLLLNGRTVQSMCACRAYIPERNYLEKFTVLLLCFFLGGKGCKICFVQFSLDGIVTCYAGKRSFKTRKTNSNYAP